MPFLTAEQISRLAVELLVRRIVLPRTVLRVPGRDFAGPSGGTVTLRVPVPREAREQETPKTPITFDDTDEVPQTFQVRHIYDGEQVSDEDLTLSIEDFGRQVLAPQVAAVATRAERELAAAMNDLTAETSFPIEPADPGDEDHAGLEDTILEAGELLDNDDVPAGDRTLAVGSRIARRLLRNPKLVKVNESGSPDALRQASLGNLYGFEIVKSAALTSTEATAYHRSGFAFATVTPVSPQGAASSSTAARDGITVRVIRQYNPSILSEEVVTSVFAGALALAEDDPPTDFVRSVKIDTATS